MNNTFHRGQMLTHVKTQKAYCITEVPQEHKLLENCNEPFYAYRSYGEATDHVIWYRRKREMEDGRFRPRPCRTQKINIINHLNDKP